MYAKSYRWKINGQPYFGGTHVTWTWTCESITIQVRKLQEMFIIKQWNTLGLKTSKWTTMTTKNLYGLNVA
jgi:hypothetical protein